MTAISDGKKMRSKLDTRDTTGIFVAYIDDHAGNVYRFINIQTKQIILSRDLQCLNSFWKEYKKKRMTQRNWLMDFNHMKKMIRPKMIVKQKSVVKTEIEETKDSGDGNSTEDQRSLGLIFKGL